MVDRITALVVKDSLEAISEEMSKTVERTAVHPLFNEVHDYSTGVFFYDGHDVRLVARATAIPVHIFASILSVEALMDTFGDDLHEGDVVMVNDPYYGGTHHADWTVMKPVFFDGKPVLFPSVRAHMADFGGPVAGGYNPEARDIWQEALRIPPIKLFEKGQLREDVLDWILANSRIPQVLRGDLAAMFGACTLAEQRIQALFAKYGGEVVNDSIEYTLDYAEKRFRAEVAKWPDGRYRGAAVLDHDSLGSHDVEVTATIHIEGSDLSVDFAGSSPETPGFVNSPFGNTASWVYTALCSVLPDDIPINSGVFRAVRISAPEGTVVNPLPPAPCMFSTVVIGGDIGTATMRALEQAIPDRAGAVSLNYCLCTTYGHDSRYDAMFVTIEYGNTLVAASGTRGSDGWGGWPAPMCGLIYSTVEMSEIQFPFFYHQYEYVADTAAAGQWRGVPGFAMKRESVRDESIINVALTGVRHTAPGYAGGKDGASSRYVLNWGTEHEEEVLESAANRPSPPGSIIATFKGGGGGWGDPLRRDPQKVLDDVLDEYLSVERAEQDYGVVIDPETLSLDMEETIRRRARLAK